MFTGIIECQGIVNSVISNGSNTIFWISSPLSDELVPDQSICHDGVCMTVEAIQPGTHQVTAIAETLAKTNLGSWKTGKTVNLERCLRPGDRIDGHFVQGHIDTTATCTKRKDKDGSIEFKFEFPKKFAALIIEKGSVCINGISLTAFNVTRNSFTVAIIPYTSDHTNIGLVKKADQVNLEFDMLGKYLIRKLSLNKK